MKAQIKKIEKSILGLDEKYFRNTKYTFNLELNEFLSTERLIELGYDVKNRTFNFSRFNDFDSFKAIFTASNNSVISWSDDERQPKEGDILFALRFSCGPYIFGNLSDDDYPKEFFKQFIKELKSFNPDYIDTANSSLYWNIENGADIFNAFDGIFLKYRKLNEIDFQRRMIEKKKAEIEKIESRINDMQ